MRNRGWHRTLALVILLAGAIVAVSVTIANRPAATGKPSRMPLPQGMEEATLGAGCFWCTEAIFQQLRGVHSVISGYSGGHVPNPSYRQVCGGTTGHAEVIHVVYDPRLISYAELLEVFWKSHDPTTRNRQGPDAGPQYRSVVFYHNPQQRDEAEHYRNQLDDSGAFASPIVTEIAPFTEFYSAEDYHQDYFEENSRQPYCAMFIQPKLEKLKEAFQDKLKTAQGQ